MYYVHLNQIPRLVQTREAHFLRTSRAGPTTTILNSITSTISVFFELEHRILQPQTFFKHLHARRNKNKDTNKNKEQEQRQQTRRPRTKKEEHKDATIASCQGVLLRALPARGVPDPCHLFVGAWWFHQAVKRFRIRVEK